MMMISRTMMMTTLVVVLMAMMTPSTMAFAPSRPAAWTTMTKSSSPSTFLMAKPRRSDADLSEIETRDMTREEMIRFNKLTEEKMNEELGMMTAFGAITCLPILYLCWVAFFSE